MVYLALQKDLKVNMIHSVLHIAQHQFHQHLGCQLQKTSNNNNNVVAVIGDGAMSAGMAYEAMNNAGALKSNLIVVLNDNDMSIARPVGAMSKYLANLLSGKLYFSFRETIKMIISSFSKRFSHKAGKAEDLLRNIVTGGTLFNELGFYYVGPIDGHDCRKFSSNF